ncbi:type II toxin-antitoxin system CcdA family antitoxin [Undibacterium sp. RTI2.1]|nr:MULTISPECIES: type II toxin-antitoxin system CcdA family antitoxin [unclassified Undibacterium]MDY7537749.1 type II toxin-antitoxin system CcdA family antitoxin [Undibacterium sp. 5I1]MEB0030563.1 type II toxin-antitoxin system CcdA family antitoxin [Undibacterium sp. RTI2.1]MEB0116936.1 type II toxin-antitoxin system CcdA family antitoxin [Undibacterium sp. RTI2.2]MEB0229866.1 type II toxin-antitoxin system CcdA family antitoxin [Undibacterium sp. 10I3]MEB0257669.1 type II toxin-antitoxin 
MSALYDQNAPKKTTNLSINSDFLKRAGDLDINFFSILEVALINQMKLKQAELWLAQKPECYYCTKRIHRQGRRVQRWSSEFLMSQFIVDENKNP